MSDTSPSSSSRRAFHSSIVSQLIAQWPHPGPLDAKRLLEGQPALRGDSRLLLDLAYEEFCQRTEAGELVSEEMFLDCFPEIKSELVRLLDVHRILSENPELTELPSDSSWPAPGTMLAGLELMEEVGRGGLSRVFLARETALGGRLVIAKLTPDPGSEGIVLGQLEHPLIVPVLSITRDPPTGLTAICMPYYGRVTLQDVLRAAFGESAPVKSWDDVLTAAGLPHEADETRSRWRRRLSYVEGVIEIGIRVAEALQFAHDRQFLHCDIKPSNILLRDRLVPMLLDFNLARSQLTDTICVGGTLPYMAPECIWGDAGDGFLDARADVYSLAATLYQLLCGCLPYASESPGTHLEAALSLRTCQSREELQNWDDLVARVGTEIAQVLKAALSFDRANRPPTAAAFAESLKQTRRHRIRLRRWARRHRASLVIASTLFLCIASWTATWIANLPPYEVRQYAAGIHSLRAMEFDEAVERFDSVLESQPERRDVLFLRGVARLRAGQHELAFRDLSKVADNSKSAIVEAERGYWICLASGRHEAALTHFERAAAMGLTSAAVHNNVGYCYYRLLRFREARPHLLEAIRLDPNSGICRLNLAWLEYRSALSERRPPDLTLFDVEGLGESEPEMAALALCAWAAASKFGTTDREQAAKLLARAQSARVSSLRIGEARQLAPGSVPETFARPVDLENPEEPLSGSRRLLDPVAIWLKSPVQLVDFD